MKKQEAKRGRGRPRKQIELGGPPKSTPELGVDGALKASYNAAVTALVASDPTLQVVKGPTFKKLLVGLPYTTSVKHRGLNVTFRVEVRRSAA